MNIRTSVVCGLALFTLLFTEFSGAQTLDTFEWVTTPNESVARISFNGNVRFMRQAPRPEELSDQLQLSFQIVASDETILKQVIEEGRRLAEADGKPRVDLTYVPLASVPTKLITVRFAKPLLVSVRQGPNARSIDLVFVDTANKLPAQAFPSMAEPLQDRHFAVMLQSQRGAQTLPKLPMQLQAYALFNRRIEQGVDGAAELLLGYFKTEEDANFVRGQVLNLYPEAHVIPWNAMPQAAGDAEVAEAAASTAAEVDAKGSEYLRNGKLALDQKRYQDAVDIFNQALMLPPNASARETQELIGQAWESLNSPAKARLEYQLYLKLYPDSPEAPRIARRLASIDAGSTASASPTTATPVNAEKSHIKAAGSISQYYYGGNTQSQTLVNIASGIDQVTLNQTNQSVLVTSWDASARYDGDGGATNVVFRGANSYNLSSNSTTTAGTQGMVGTAYLDFHGADTRNSLRVGRQQSIGAAMFGLFDGVSVAAPVGDQYRVSGMVGVPANPLVNAPSQVLSGVMLEANNISPSFGGSLSLVDQTTEHISDRRAVGLDARYFGEAASVFTQIDYDINFETINAITIQGSMPGIWDTTWTMMVDDRKAPSLQLSDALIPTGYTSLAQLLQDKSRSEVLGYALATAAEAKQAMISVSRALAPKWQGSLDWQYSEIGAIPAIGLYQATPATGAQYTVSMQVTGSNLYSSRDINGFNLSYLTSDVLVGTQLGYNNSTGIWDGKGSIEPSIHYYTQQDNTSTTTTRVTPAVRMSYRVNNRASVMGELIYESSQVDGPQNHETSTAVYFYVGYRYDFQ